MRLLENGNEDEGVPVLTERDELIQQIEDLQHQLAEARKKALDRQVVLVEVQNKLLPFYNLLRAIFGDLKAADLQTATEPLRSHDHAREKWVSWKQKMPGKPAEFIDLLLLHGEMTAAQLKAAAHCSSDTVYQVIYKLNAAQLINKNGGRFSLKT
jgi:hypothetical protein